jgi:hypothetical protein
VFTSVVRAFTTPAMHPHPPAGSLPNHLHMAIVLSVTQYVLLCTLGLYSGVPAHALSALHCTTCELINSSHNPPPSMSPTHQHTRRPCVNPHDPTGCDDSQQGGTHADLTPPQPNAAMACKVAV